MEENKFLVDLGDLKLTAAQHNAINGAIQAAVSSEIAKIAIKDNVIFIPRVHGPKGPIFPGFVIRKVSAAQLQKSFGL